jgi:hypothetical protein
MRLLSRCIASALLAIGLILPTIALTNSGCQNSSTARITHNTLFSIERATIGAVDSYDSLVISGALPTNDVPKVSQAFNAFQLSMQLAIAVAHGNTNAIAPPSLALESANLINTINQIKKAHQ